MNFVTDTTIGVRTAHNTWHQQLEATESAEHILVLTRDYLATFGPEHLARLPEECRPGRIKGEDDIAFWSCRLAQYNHRDPEMRIDAELLQELLSYFLHAWVRLSQIQRRTPESVSHLVH